MADLNYFSGIVKILEAPKENILDDKFNVIQCKVQLPPLRGNRIVILNFWGRLTKNNLKNYTVLDYVLVEGYISMRSSPKKTEISAIKIHPYVINSNR